MSYFTAREQANARNFARAQEAWDRMTPPEYDLEAAEEAALDAAGDEVLRNGGMIADAMAADVVNGGDYDAVNVERICRPEFAADDKPLATLLAVMASGDAESARRALMAWRLRLPDLLKQAISDRAAELLRGEE